MCCNVEGETNCSYKKLPIASPTWILRLWRGFWKPQKNFESRWRHDSKHSPVQAVLGPWKWDRLVVPKRRAETVLRCIKFQRSAMSLPRQKPEITERYFFYSIIVLFTQWKLMEVWMYSSTTSLARLLEKVNCQLHFSATYIRIRSRRYPPSRRLGGHQNLLFVIHRSQLSSIFSHDDCIPQE